MRARVINNVRWEYSSRNDEHSLESSQLRAFDPVQQFSNMGGSDHEVCVERRIASHMQMARHFMSAHDAVVPSRQTQSCHQSETRIEARGLTVLHERDSEVQEAVSSHKDICCRAPLVPLSIDPLQINIQAGLKQCMGVVGTYSFRPCGDNLCDSLQTDRLIRDAIQRAWIPVSPHLEIHKRQSSWN